MSSGRPSQPSSCMGVFRPTRARAPEVSPPPRTGRTSCGLPRNHIFVLAHAVSCLPSPHGFASGSATPVMASTAGPTASSRASASLTLGPPAWVRSASAFCLAAIVGWMVEPAAAESVSPCHCRMHGTRKRIHAMLPQVAQCVTARAYVAFSAVFPIAHRLAHPIHGRRRFGHFAQFGVSRRCCSCGRRHHVHFA